MARVLAIKLSALGDIFMALGALKAIRLRHPDDRLAILTTAPYAGLLERTGLFDDILIDTRPKLTELGKALDLRRTLRKPGFTHVYDLQGNNRTTLYFYTMLWRPGIVWSGFPLGANQRRNRPDFQPLHSVDRLAKQLNEAGIADVPEPDLGFMEADIARYGLPARFALLVPGCSPTRLVKRWPAERYGELACWLSDVGITPVVIGRAQDEGDAVRTIARMCPSAINLLDDTDLDEMASLARAATVCVANDTGPMHIAAFAGCPTVALFSAASNPVQSGGRGPAVICLQEPDLNALSLGRVRQAVLDVIEKPRRNGERTVA